MRKLPSIRALAARAPGWLPAALAAVAALALYAATLLPDIGGGDVSEFQLVAPSLGLAHPTGYPLFTLLGFGWSHLPLGGSAAWRMNLLSAVFGGLAVGAAYLAGRALGQARLIALAAALALGASATFWSQATIAEVYTLAVLLQLAFFLALLGWRAERLPLWIAGLVFGLGLAHHRTIVLLAPGAAAFVLLAARSPGAPRLTWRACGAALLAALLPCLLYLYIPLRAPADADRWKLLWDYASGEGFAASWINLPRLEHEGAGRLLDLAQRFIWPQFFPPGAILAVLGGLRLLRRDRAVAALLLPGYLAVLAFAAVYYVNDVEVFLIPAHAIAALLLGEGLAALVGRLPRRATTAAGALALAWPLALAAVNLPAIHAANLRHGDIAARAVMAEPLPPRAMLLTDWYNAGALRYLQVVEGRRFDIELIPTIDPADHLQRIRRALADGRAVYLTQSWTGLGMAQWPEGLLWRVGDGAPELKVDTPSDAAWEDGIRLDGFALPHRTYRPGEIVPLTLAWQAGATPDRRYTLFVHLVDEHGTIWGQQDREPERPTDAWRPGDRMLDLYGPAINPAAPPGRYHVLIGWYDFTTLHRLPRAGGSDLLDLGAIDVGAAVVQ